ncbi:MAG: chemotaxis protein CheA [Thermodesulfobacteriota bacterium]|nr:chemotaxis protein CheA [Thermodesulfobacteriota bacterium]
MSNLAEINKNIEAIALEVVTLEADDISALGNILKLVEELEENSRGINHSSFLTLIPALKGYIEKLALRETDDAGPLDEGVRCLQSIYRCLSNQAVFGEDISHLLERLGFRCLEAEDGERATATPEQVVVEDGGEGIEVVAETETSPMGEELGEDDREIISDFVMESLEGLGTIEVSLVDLEQDPGNLETINAIFRPFHTIKGVSAFIELKKINQLAHSAENLLDKARNGEIRIEGTVIDLILESVDMLKKMIQGVRSGLEKGISLDNGVDITPLKERIDEVNSLADQMGEKRVGEILVQKGAITTDDLEEGLEKQKEETDKKIGEILLEEKRVDSKEVISALRDQKRFGARQIDLQVKVDTKKLDNLVDLTGELVIAQSMLRQNQWIRAGNDQKLLQNLGQLTQITSSLQTTAMSMRMVPIRNTFQKMLRVVRDLTKNSGKEAWLEMSGEETEIDRNVVEELYDPMVHMIRNAVDHGIEPPDEREKAGKRRRGHIHLKAYHRGGNIIVEIEDDGRGLDRERIVERAKSGNLITDEAKLTDSEIYNLIFHAGFSTAKRVTDISGRGVGMDVVKKAIERLRGRVEINSRPGEGSTFVISLPLTLAIIEGMLVRVERERYIIPALAILESFRPDKSQCFTVEGKGEMIMSRGNLIPLIRLHGIFGVNGGYINPWEGLVVAVEHEGGQIGLLLDELLGKEEVVIKSLGEGLKDIKGVAGGAILGDGRVGLILDMAGIFDIAKGN